MAEKSDIQGRAQAFSITLLSACGNATKQNGGQVLVDQLIRSGTSIGANAYEANYAASKADFINKLQISLKECYETEYWLSLTRANNNLKPQVVEELLLECGIIRKMLIKAITTAKRKLAQ